jgi:hypothetical protein
MALFIWLKRQRACSLKSKPVLVREVALFVQFAANLVPVTILFPVRRFEFVPLWGIAVFGSATSIMGISVGAIVFRILTGKELVKA